VAGAGALGFHHIRLLGKVEGAVCAGFFDTDVVRAKNVAEQLAVPAMTSLDALLDTCDALCIVVPTPAHAPVAHAAVARGKHLLVEKPLCASIEEADALLAAARHAGVLVQTGHVERFNRALRAAIPYVQAPRFITSERLAPFNPRGSDVAVVLDLMIHDIDLVLTLLGGNVSDVQALGVPVLTPSVDIANARMVFAGGEVATITASRVSRERMRKLRVFQRSGYLSLDLAAGTGHFYRVRGDFDPSTFGDSPPSLESVVEYVPLSAPEDEPLRLELQSFVDAVRGSGPLVVTGDDGRAALAVALRIMEEIERSMRGQMPVGMPAAAARA